MYYLAVYLKASPYRLVGLAKQDVVPIMPYSWFLYDDGTQNYLVGVSEDALPDSYWDPATALLTDDAVTALGIAPAERSKYVRGLTIEASDLSVPVSYYTIDAATGVITLTTPAVAAQTTHLDVGFVPGDPAVDLTGGPDGEPLTSAEPTVTIRVKKLYSDGSTVITATDALTFVPSTGRSGIQTANLVAGVYDFTYTLPAETAVVTIKVRSAVTNCNPGVLVFFRDFP